MENTDSVLERPRRASAWWLGFVLLVLVALTGFILVSAGETRIPFMYTTSGP